MISARRLIFPQKILNILNGELIREVYSAIKENLIKDKCINIVQLELKHINLNISEDIFIYQFSKKTLDIQDTQWYKVSYKKGAFISNIFSKLDGVGPVDNRPSTD